METLRNCCGTLACWQHDGRANDSDAIGTNIHEGRANFSSKTDQAIRKKYSIYVHDLGYVGTEKFFEMLFS
ncbi:hypothetical protein Tcan_02868 [Toxocara canis]|uniref:Uncharacterized protein n=1 Tax=Toxocara canis TaxID=6265 RepID=A0A0B2VA87_TOXCA|nr:hypothetical protein Tcan_02868 [Toxocara canis]